MGGRSGGGEQEAKQREGGWPSLQRLAFDAGAAETSPLPETEGQTDKHRWRERLCCFIYGPGDRPSPVSVTNLPGGRHPTPSPPFSLLPETGAQPGSKPPQPVGCQPLEPVLVG